MYQREIANKKNGCATHSEILLTWSVALFDKSGFESSTVRKLGECLCEILSNTSQLNNSTDSEQHSVVVIFSMQLYTMAQPFFVRTIHTRQINIQIGHGAV